MADERQIIPAEEFCESVRDGTHDSPKSVEEGHYLVTSRHIIGGQLDLSKAYRISDQDFQAINKRSKVDLWDVLISMIGTVGEACLIKDEPNFAIKNIGLFKTGGEVQGKWLYYYLRSPKTQQLIRAHSRGSTQQYIPLGALRTLPVLVPEKSEEMLSVVDVLSSIDDKIDLNRRTNCALETMARAIFKAWFIDFEPVHAKAEGATDFPGMPQIVFDELPDRFTDTDFGAVPDGWSVGVLGEVVQERKDRAKPSPETRSLPYVPIDCITSKSLWLEDSKSGDEAKSSLVSFDEDDILFGAMRPYFHKVCLAPFAGTTRTTVFILRPKTPSDLSFSLLLLSEVATIDYATQHSVGSTIPYAKWDKSLAHMPIVCPPPNVRECFHTIVWPMLEQLKRPYFENRVLGSIRDTLLPQLISGEIRLTEDGEVQHGG